ncbi:uncharacterized protein TRAVEDRAFT_41074 [Trametes versicolor FP-101664 SS1]|uniref:Uncharacterized protein n=1 Tax=Trametes versicolor (strain FP-101664) TaxID=717944 RepID=R7S7H3_TRAVS|nr:uncharacterized protein TRAVEDRAFT_41074 [Trametes versicolor FP-101664 SS1]EIW51560.1 hypothetical protein TRAVEDRAFT_41074 [Trametes versicolor FP-101664 SS1]
MSSDFSDATRDTYNPARPPPLNYTIKCNRRELAIIVFFTLIFAEAGVLPLILFYSIRWGAHLDNTKILAIITSLVGTYSGYKMARRSYYLFISDRGHQRRPLGASRFGPDAFTIQISLAMTGFFVPLIIGSSLNPGSVQTVAMSLPCFMICFCVPLLLTGLWPHKLKMPFRVSSMPPYTGLPPAVYTMVEDVVAVDGGGCVEFRQAWRIRYEHSAIMRRIVRVTSLWWGASGCLFAGAFIAIAWTTADDIGYGIGWGLPWLWAMVSGALTIGWVHRELEREQKMWADPDVHKIYSLHITQTVDEEKVAEEVNDYNERNV